MPDAKATFSETGTFACASAAAAAAQRGLRTSSYRGLLGVRCDPIDGAMVLRGRVPTYHIKQMAQEVVRKQDAALAIVNLVEVDDPSESDFKIVGIGERPTSPDRAARRQRAAPCSPTS